MNCKLGLPQFEGFFNHGRKAADTNPRPWAEGSGDQELRTKAQTDRQLALQQGWDGAQHIQLQMALSCLEAL